MRPNDLLQVFLGVHSVCCHSQHIVDPTHCIIHHTQNLIITVDEAGQKNFIDCPVSRTEASPYVTQRLCPIAAKPTAMTVPANLNYASCSIFAIDKFSPSSACLSPVLMLDIYCARKESLLCFPYQRLKLKKEIASSPNFTRVLPLVT